MSIERYELVPYGDGAAEALDRVMDVFGRSGVTLAECLDTDAVALSAGDLQYFDREYYGKVPSYAVFMRYLNKQPAAIRDDFMSVVAEVESGLSGRKMGQIASNTDGSATDSRIFNMYKELNRIAERRIDRIDKRVAKRADNDVRTADLATRIIEALSNKDLLRIRDNMDAIETEYKEVDE